MNSAKSVGRPIVGGTVSEVLESKAEGWAAGDLVVGYSGWQEYSIGTPEDVQWGHPQYPIEKWDSDLGEPSTALGILGMTGYTAYHGTFGVADAQPGETVVVSAASGAVGQVVGQLAKIKGCRAVGIAGGPAKCAFCTDTLGFDACIDYKAAGFADALAAACPDGIDVYFENVGGDVLEAVLPLLTPTCRVPVCGWISSYNDPGNNVSRDEQSGTPLVRLAEHGLAESGAPGLGPDAKIAPVRPNPSPLLRCVWAPDQTAPAPALLLATATAPAPAPALCVHLITAVRRGASDSSPSSSSRRRNPRRWMRSRKCQP